MKSRPQSFTLSIIVPFYRESTSVGLFFDRALPVFRQISKSFEVVAIDDGSDDDTWDRLQDVAASCAEVKLVRLSRNFGHQIALTAGLDHASGDAVVVMDGDLQDPPELIYEMMERWRQGADVVMAARRTRSGESKFKRLSAGLFYRIVNKLSDRDLPLNVGDFRLLDRQAVVALRGMREQHRYLRGMFSWRGFKQAIVEFDREPRTAGETKYNSIKMLALAFNGIFSFSRKPLQLATLLGLVFSTLAGCYMIWILLRALFYSEQMVSGWTSLIVVMLFIGGLQLLCLGLIGEYVGRTFEEVKRRPVYFVRERHGYPEITSPYPPVVEPVQRHSDVS